MPIIFTRQAWIASHRFLTGNNVVCLTSFRFLKSVQYVREGDVIYCRAIVDTINSAPAHGQGLGKFRVEVLGREPHDYCRTYEIAAKDENFAAREGMDKFIEDITALLDNQDA